MLNDKASTLNGGSIAFYRDRFRMLHLPDQADPASHDVSLVEIPLHGGGREPEVVYLSGDEADAEIATGALVILYEAPASRTLTGRTLLDVPRPYPFEAAVRRAPARRGSGAAKAALAELRRAGLIMSGAEYVRLFETRRMRVDGDGLPLDG